MGSNYWTQPWGAAMESNFGEPLQRAMSLPRCRAKAMAGVSHARRMARGALTLCVIACMLMQWTGRLMPGAPTMTYVH
jgi:hypothetical protein